VIRSPGAGTASFSQSARHRAARVERSEPRNHPVAHGARTRVRRPSCRARRTRGREWVLLSRTTARSRCGFYAPWRDHGIREAFAETRNKTHGDAATVFGIARARVRESWEPREAINFGLAVRNGPARLARDPGFPSPRRGSFSEVLPELPEGARLDRRDRARRRGTEGSSKTSSGGKRGSRRPVRRFHGCARSRSTPR